MTYSLRKLPAVAVCILACSLLGACFTGVEYTPKVTERDVARENIVLTAEDTLLRAVADEPLGLWSQGKRFLVTDSKIHLIFGSTAFATDSLGGKVITYDSAVEAPSITGGFVTDLIFLSPQGKRLVYRVNSPLAALRERESLSVPFTIQESVVDSAARIVAGRDLYILNRVWRDDFDNTVPGRRYVKVHVDSVTPGNDIYPLKVSFTDERGISACVFMHPGSRSRTPRSFPALFSFTDPKLRFPQVEKEHWPLIIDGRVAPNMTRLECRLSLGDPKEVDRGADNAYVREVWLYDNGVYLVFEDGLLKRFRH